VRTKSQLGWLNLQHLPILAPPVTAKQRVVIIPDQPEEVIEDPSLVLLQVKPVRGLGSCTGRLSRRVICTQAITIGALIWQRGAVSLIETNVLSQSDDTANFK